MFCLRNRDKKVSHSARLTSYDNKSLSWHIYLCDEHRKFLNDQSRRQIEYLIVFNIFTVCVYSGIVRNIMKIRTLFERFSKRYYICQRSQKILNSFPFDKLTIKTYGYWCKYLHNEKEFCFKKLNWKCRSKLLNNLF